MFYSPGHECLDLFELSVPDENIKVVQMTDIFSEGDESTVEKSVKFGIIASSHIAFLRILNTKDCL